jgi:hypothetical protein
MKTVFLALLLIFSVNVFATSSAGVCDKPYSIYVYKGSDIHSSLLLPSQFLKIAPYFSQFSYVEFNFGDEGFYKAGTDVAKFVTRGAVAMTKGGQGVILLTPVAKSVAERNAFCAKSSIDSCIDIQFLNPLIDARRGFEIRITEKELKNLSEAIRKLVKFDDKGTPAVAAEAAEWGYASDSFFFRSTAYYQGFTNNCVQLNARLLNANLENMPNASPSMATLSPYVPVQEFMKNMGILAKKNNCIIPVE